MTTTAASNEPHRLLLLSRDDDARAAVTRALARAGLTAVDAEPDPDRALARAVEGGHDAIVLDRLRGRTAADLTAAIRSRGAQVPVVVVAEGDDEDLDRAVLEAGASDVLSASDLSPTRLGMRVRAAIRAGGMLARAQAAAAARDELLSIVSHDLRSPLNAIVLACDALDADITDAERKRYVAAVRRAGQRAERLLRDLLDVSRIESGGLKLECRPVSAKSILDQTRADHEILARDAGSPITLELAGDVGQVLADRDRVLQVLANLVGNALKHAAGAPITLGARADGDGVVFTVADKGPGIVADALPHVFDRFWQGRSRRRGGAGLGLTIARGIVTAHGGTITVDSTVGEGTRFSVRLPRP